MSTSLLLIGYYHGLLLRDIDVDQLSNVMCSTGLLTDVDKILLSTCCSIHHKKYLLIEIARHMDKGNLLQFCQAIQEVCPRIKCQMKKGNLWLLCYVFVSLSYKIQSVSIRSFILQYNRSMSFVDILFLSYGYYLYKYSRDSQKWFTLLKRIVL